MNKWPLLIASCSIFVGSMPAFANLISNGDFSQSPPSGGCVAGTTSVPGWIVTTGNVDIISGYTINPICQSPVGPAGTTYYLDLTGSFAEYGANDVGMIAQSFSTATGSRYSVSFYFGGNAGWEVTSYPNDGPIKSMNALINGNLVDTYSVNTMGVSWTDAQWVAEQFTFTATSALSTLSFASGNGISSPSDYGPYLADVQVNPAPPSVPEPMTLALLGTGLLAIPFFVKRRRGS